MTLMCCSPRMFSNPAQNVLHGSCCNTRLTWQSTRSASSSPDEKGHHFQLSCSFHLLPSLHLITWDDTHHTILTTIQKCYLTKIPLKGLWCPQISIQLVVYISNKHRLQERDHMTITWHTARHTPITWFYRLLHDYHMHALKQKDRTYFSSPPSFLKHSDVFLMSWVQ